MSDKKLAAPSAEASAPPAAPPPAYGAAATVDLEDQIFWNGCETLNVKGKNDISMVMKQGPRDQADLLIESDADEQLLATVRFNQAVKLHSIMIDGPEGRAPKDVKLFVNKQAFAFSDAEGHAPVQELDLGQAEVGKRIELRYVKFQNVDSLTIFIASNQAEDDEEGSTAVSTIKLWGFAVQSTNMKDVRRRTPPLPTWPRPDARLGEPRACSQFKRVAGEPGEGIMGS